jgi:hypothetical protein
VVCYSMGMTMTRTEKTTAQRSLAPQADGYTTVEFASPKLIMMARADRGHIRMTPVEYATHRLGRGAVHPSMVEYVRYRLAETRRRQRVAAAKIVSGPGRRRAREERRVTGFQPGTKKPTTWTSHSVERETKRAV